MILCLLDELCAPMLQGFLCKKMTRFYSSGSGVVFYLVSFVPHCCRAFFVRKRPDSSAVALMLCLLNKLCAPLLLGILCTKMTRF